MFQRPIFQHFEGVKGIGQMLADKDMQCLGRLSHHEHVDGPLWSFSKPDNESKGGIMAEKDM
jgi:hypothetical protein